MRSVKEIKKVVGYISLNLHNDTIKLIPIHSIRKTKSGITVETDRHSEILKLFKQCSFRFEKNSLLTNNFTFNYSIIKIRKTYDGINFGQNNNGYLSNLTEISDQYKFNIINI